MEDTIFGKILRREIPAEIIYENEKTLAFLDITPNNPGHTLVIPKKPFRNIFDVDSETFADVMETVRILAKPIRKAVGADGMNIYSNHEKEAGQAVFHLHVHLIPRFSNDGYKLWEGTPYPKGEAKKVADSIRKSLS